MSFRATRSLRLSLNAAALAAFIGLAQPAAAQLLFDWGGQEKVNDTGREFGRFNGTDVKPGEIIVSFSDRRLYLVTQPGFALSYPIAIPREEDRWQGITSVTQKRENPSWTPTPSMLKENPRLPRWVPGGHPLNPLGNRALYLGSSYYRIHGTDAPWTIGTAVSKGCIRMYNKDAQDVFERVKLGAKVLVTWKQFQFSPAPDQSPPIALSTPPTPTRMNASHRTVEPAPSMAAPTQPRRQRADDVVEYDEHMTPRRPAAEARTAVQEPKPQPSPRVNRPRTSERPTPPAPSQPRARASRVETGALPAAGTSGSAASEIFADQVPSEQPQRQAPAAQAAAAPVESANRSTGDSTSQVLEAAQRAAAAAERAAAAAERAERAAAAKAASAVGTAPGAPPATSGE